MKNEIIEYENGLMKNGIFIGMDGQIDVARSTDPFAIHVKAFSQNQKCPSHEEWAISSVKIDQYLKELSRKEFIKNALSIEALIGYACVGFLIYYIYIEFLV